ncbi:MAG: hypothetical protein WKG07_10905 [Hymenobacter sp.]
MKNAATATGATVGFGAGELVKGRKRLVLINTLGNVLASRVVPAHVSDAAAAIAFWDEVAAHPSVAGPSTRGHGRQLVCRPFCRAYRPVLRRAIRETSAYPVEKEKLLHS